MGTLASQAEIGVRVQARAGSECGKGSPHPATGVRGYHPPKNFETVHCVSPFGRKMVGNVVHNAFFDTLTIGTAFTRVLPRNDLHSTVLR